MSFKGPGEAPKALDGNRVSKKADVLSYRKRTENCNCTCKVGYFHNYEYLSKILRWNDRYIKALVEGAVKTLNSTGVISENIHIESVPGSWELPIATSRFPSYSDNRRLVLIPLD